MARRIVLADSNGSHDETHDATPWYRKWWYTHVRDRRMQRRDPVLDAIRADLASWERDLDEAWSRQRLQREAQIARAGRTAVR